MHTRISILIVEDDKALSCEIQEFLQRWGYHADRARHFDQILSDFSTSHPQLVLMDINLPCYDGFYWCSRIREISDVPIIFISSRSDDRDKIMGIAQGGDDYVEKPFHLELLRAKIEAILRRTYQYRVRDRLYLNPELCFEPDSASLLLRDKELELTRSEKKIFSRLMDSRPEVVSREDLMLELWSTDEYVSDGTLTTLISRLRSKLKSACGQEIIHTKKGLGYFIE
ncbi:MAG: response regulator transcription factor [Lachnospiraceae bacterium]